MSSSSTVAQPQLITRRLAWAILAVLALAALLRAWNITGWSMWEDEEGSLRLAQRPFVGFQGYFPVFFVALNKLLAVTGLSVGAARALPAMMGLVSVALTYFCFRRFVGAGAALLAALLIAVNLGHLFFSQSIRYYTTVLVFQMLSLYWFLDGFERDRLTSLLLANLAFVLALLTHFSAVLLAPVFIGYLLLMILRRETAAGYRPRNYLFFGLALGVILSLFAWQIAQLRNMIGGWVIPSARDPVHVGLNVLAYFGVPVLGLSLLAPWLAIQLPRRVFLFLSTASIIPVLELLVIAQMNVVNVTWYYAFIALIGFALLAGAVFIGLWEQGRRRAVAALGSASLLYQAAFLICYFTFWHGDRPRWEEAAYFLQEAAVMESGKQGTTKVIATVPYVLAFYLEADSHRPESYTFVQIIPHQLVPIQEQGACWYVVEAKTLCPEDRAWLDLMCELKACFESHTGPIDRTVLVYHTTGKSGLPIANGH
jgi:hypothetical protein